MMKRFRTWQNILAVIFSCSATTAWGQLPSQSLSPLNQLGRSWGFGVSDGYHECKSCSKPGQHPQDILRVANSNLFYRSPEHRPPSMVDRINPFKGVTACEPQPFSGYGLQSTNAMPMTVLPPSPEMYQQFAVPQSTTLPESGNQHAEPMVPSGNPSTSSPWSSSPSDKQPVPDPVPNLDAQRRNSVEKPPVPEEKAAVPPAPLRKRQKGDKPLGEEPKAFKPIDDDSLLSDPQSNSDDRLDLLPRSEQPPITLQPRTHSKNSVLDRTNVQYSQTWNVPGNDWMLQEYYGNAYSRPEMPRPVQANRSSMNRYR